MLPQFLIDLNINFIFIEQISTWGFFSESLYFIHTNNYISYLFSFLGLIGFIISQNIFKLKFLKIKFKKYQTSNKIVNNTIKKEPIININTKEKDTYSTSVAKNGVNKIVRNNFIAPSLEILENNLEKSDNKSNKETITKNSKLLEEVFADFNIEIKVINVKLGPVITLYEILPAAVLKLIQL